MVKSYRIIHQWDYWLTQALGKDILKMEQNALASRLTGHYGKHALLVGVPNQYELLKTTSIPHQILISPLINRHKNVRYIESGFYELPIASGSIDRVILPHTLEYVDNPNQLLAEVCRVVKPEGHILILGFNPLSLWGLAKWCSKSHHAPWGGNFISSRHVKKWLDWVDFELLHEDKLVFRPPVQFLFYQKLKFLEKWGRISCIPFAGIYLLTARAKVIPLTPIRLRWKQALSTVQTTVPRPTSMREF